MVGPLSRFFRHTATPGPIGGIFLEGLDDAEIRYLYGVVRRALVR